MGFRLETSGDVFAIAATVFPSLSESSGFPTKDKLSMDGFTGTVSISFRE